MCQEFVSPLCAVESDFDGSAIADYDCYKRFNTEAERDADCSNGYSGVPTAQEQTRKERAAKAEALLHSTNLSADDVIGDAVCALFENWVGLGLDFSQEDMPHFRQLIALSLLNKEFLK